MKVIGAVLLSTTVLAFVPVAYSFQADTGKETRKTGSANRMNEGSATADHAFAMKAAEGGMAEVELGNLAKQNGSNSAVKDFGQRMVDDHSKANNELKDLAGKQNITLPTAMNSQDQAEKDRLSKLTGHAFDRAYMKMMVTDHRKDVAEFKRESTSGKNPDLKAWAGKTLPTLQEHLKMAEDTERQVSSGKAATTK
jgi:putative membrane protein